MKIIFRETFARDLRKLKDRKTLDAIEKAINAVLAADRLMDIPPSRR